MTNMWLQTLIKSCLICVSVYGYPVFAIERAPNHELQSKLDEITASLRIMKGLDNAGKKNIKVEDEVLLASSLKFTVVESRFAWPIESDSEDIVDFRVTLTYTNPSHAERLMAVIGKWLEDGYTVLHSEVEEDINRPKFITVMQYRLVK